jgi:hypothetical protein
MLRPNWNWSRETDRGIIAEADKRIAAQAQAQVARIAAGFVPPGFTVETPDLSAAASADARELDS